jgi:hypothetical protein
MCSHQLKAHPTSCKGRIMLDAWSKNRFVSELDLQGLPAGKSSVVQLIADRMPAKRRCKRALNGWLG